jgi:hypothetical protein
MAMALTGHLSMPAAGAGGGEILISVKKYDISWYVMQYVRKGAQI